MASFDPRRFHPSVVEQIYRNELSSAEGSKTVPLHKVAQLEISQYLESYLWPNFDSHSSSFEHIMSIVLMINEKFRENVPVWQCFHGNGELFTSFLNRVFTLQKERTLTLKEKTNYLLFLIHAFQSLEEVLVEENILRFVSMELWFTLSPGRLKMELYQDEKALKPWLRLKKKISASSSIDIREKLEATFLPALLRDFLQILESAIVENEANSSAVLYCERFLEFLIDLLGQTPTRRYVKSLVNDLAVVVKCRMSSLRAHPQGKLFGQLLELLQFYEDFQLDDQKGLEVQVQKKHFTFLHSFQLLAFNQVPKLKEMALSNVASIESRAKLTKWLSRLTFGELQELVCNKLMLIPSSDPWTEKVSFLTEVLVSSFEKRQTQREFINCLPLYPTEKVMWDESLVPSVNYTGEGCLALPKLNLQFLTLNDYLLRNFNLFRLESTYEIRENIHEVLQKLGAYVGDEGLTKFRGWARMAVPINNFRLVQVKEPNIGDVKPSSVTAEITYSIARCPGHVKPEWDELKEHDVLFLLSILPPLHPPASEEAAKLAVPERYGLQCVRGCEIIELRDEAGNLMNDFTGRVRREEWKPPQGDVRTAVVALDSAQYQVDRDANTDQEVYGSFNVLVRRKPKENNFKAILESIRDLTNEDCFVPGWLHDLVLGYFNPTKWRTNEPLQTIDFKDTFLDAQHLRESFPEYEVRFVSPDGDTDNSPIPPFRVTFPDSDTLESRKGAKVGRRRLKRRKVAAVTNESADMEIEATGERDVLTVEPYVAADPGPYPQDQPKQNSVRFTPVQVEAIQSGVQPGLTMVVGPPGTGKTDTAVQILNVLYHNCPSQRTLLITHSNQALNDLFEKIMQRDVPARYLLRLGQGEQELETELDFSRQGRVNAMLARRLELLAEVERLAKTFGLPEDMAYTCETAAHFWLLHVFSRWEGFVAACEASRDDPGIVLEKFPFKEYFSDVSRPLFSGLSYAEDMRSAAGCFKHLKTMFLELEECRAFELLKTTVDRANYLMTKQAKIVAMTCTHAALKRRDFIKVGFKYDNLLMEESAQVLEIETFIPMLLQKQEDGQARLKRCILIGDHHQLPPVVKNMAFQKYSHLDQSLFARFIRLGVPHVELNAQGRARPSIAKLYNWRYKDLGDLPEVQQNTSFLLANAGFAYDYQLIDVPDYLGRGEREPSHWFYQNLGEAEYIVSVYQYMRLLGYPANRISILTTYNGQKHLIRDVIANRCADHPLFGRPSKITTVDRFQGQQNDYVLLSLVRTRMVGHLRDVRRLIVAMSRARLGLYVFCRRSLFEQCYELQPAFKTLLQRPDKLALALDETSHPTSRRVEDTGNIYLVQNAVEELNQIVMNKFMQSYGETGPSQPGIAGENSNEIRIVEA